MTREELLKMIDGRISLNDFAINNYGTADALRYKLKSNNESWDMIKSELEKTENSDDSYEQGMRDIWNLMQKIYCEPDFRTFRKHEEIFGWEYTSDILERLSPGEALFRMREYEDKKRKEAEKPVVGDVVEFDCCGPRTGVLLYENSTHYWVLESAGTCPQKMSKENFSIKKTGKHVDLEGLFK